MSTHQYFKLLPANIYMFKVHNRNTRKWCEICSKLTAETPERRHFCAFGLNAERYILICPGIYPAIQSECAKMTSFRSFYC